MSGGIVAIDRATAEAWPALETVELDGWLLRFTHGVTRRANSVLAIGGEPAALPERVDAAERFYAQRQAPARFLVSDASASAALAPLLAARGYRSEVRTIMMAASVEVVELATKWAAPWRVELADRLDERWFCAYGSEDRPSQATPVRERMLREVLLVPPAPALFVTVTGPGHGSPTAVGQLVLHDCGGSVQCMTTVPARRRRGGATAVLHAMASAAAEAGVDHLHLGVEAANAGAIALYERAGFAPSHEYLYLVAPPAGG